MNNRTSKVTNDEIDEKLTILCRENATLGLYKAALIKEIYAQLNERVKFEAGLYGEVAMVLARKVLTKQLNLLQQNNSVEENEMILIEINKTKMEYEKVRCFYENNIPTKRNINNSLEQIELQEFGKIKEQAKALKTQQKPHMKICEEIYILTEKEITKLENKFKNTMELVKKHNVKTLCDEQLHNYRNINNVYKQKMVEFGGEQILRAEITSDELNNFRSTIDTGSASTPSTSTRYAHNSSVTFQSSNKAKEAEGHYTPDDKKKGCNIS